MISLFRRHCFLIAAGILLWQGWAASSASSATPGTVDGDAPPLPPPVFTGEELAQRDPSVAPLAPADPFLLRELLLLRAASGQQATQSATAPAGDSGQDQQALTPMVRLTLQSTMPNGAHGRAWINGHDLTIGDVIPGVSAQNQPVLKTVAGSTVTISWSGRDYFLDLYSAAAIELPLTTEVEQ